MTETPFFSVVLATFGRGRHIAPTIESVLRQSFADFELLVVGDGCDDETESAVRSFADPRVSWRNLPRNGGSQSFPNNEGIRAARGEWIAYIGHDDIWTADHLASLRATIRAESEADFAVAVCVYHTPPGTGLYYIHGLFDASHDLQQHFFPPSALAHRRDVPARIGPWADPRTLCYPVDLDFQIRAVNAGLVFAGTRELTVHKFAAGHRYLSYLMQSSDEQREMLDALRAGKGPDSAEIIRAAKRDGTFMPPVGKLSGRRAEPGYFYERNRQSKGITRPKLSPLRHRTVIRQENDGRSLDWYDLKRRFFKRFRWSGPNPRPKILIPYTGRSARITLKIWNSNLGDLSMQVEGKDIAFLRRTDWAGRQIVSAEIPLKADDYTLLTLTKPTVPLSRLDGGRHHRQVGVALSDIVLEPAE